MRLVTPLAILALASPPAYAYIGPGAGLGAIATLVAVVLGIALVIVGFLWYPLKRLIKKRKKPQLTSEGSISPGKGDQ